MKKQISNIAMILVLVSTLAMSCSTNDKKEDSKLSKKTTTSSDIASDSTSEEEDDTNGEAMISLYIEEAIPFTKDACESMLASYNNFKTAGNEDDGVLEIYDINITLYDLSSAMYKYQDDKTYEQYNNESGGYPAKFTEYFTSTVDPYLEKLDSIHDKLEELSDDQSSDGAKALDGNLIHTYMKEIETAINDSDFGPCSLS